MPGIHSIDSAGSEPFDREAVESQLNDIDELVGRVQEGVSWVEQEGAASTLDRATMLLRRISLGPLPKDLNNRVHFVAERIQQCLPSDEEPLSRLDKQTAVSIRKRLEGVERSLEEGLEPTHIVGDELSSGYSDDSSASSSVGYTSVRSSPVELSPWQNLDLERLEGFHDWLGEMDAKIDHIWTRDARRFGGVDPDAPVKKFDKYMGMEPTENVEFFRGLDLLADQVNYLANDIQAILIHLEDGRADRITEGAIRELAVLGTCIDMVLRDSTILERLAEALATEVEAEDEEDLDETVEEEVGPSLATVMPEIDASIRADARERSQTIRNALGYGPGESLPFEEDWSEGLSSDD